MTVERSAPLYFVTVVRQGGASPQRVDMTGRVLQVVYEDLESAADKLTLTVDNYDLANFDDPIWAKGNALEVQWGYAQDLTPTRTCLIQSVKGFQQLTVEALAKSILMHKTMKSRVFKAMTRAQVVAQVAGENGYGTSAQQIEDSKVVFDTIVQARETDAAFLMRLAKREGFQFFIDFDGLHWHRRKLGQQPVREYVWFLDPAQGEVQAISIENDVTAKPAAVTHSGRDLLGKQDFSVTGSNDDTTRTGLAPVLELVDPRTGQTTLQAGTGQATIAPSSEPNAAAAQRQVNGSYINSVLTTVQLTLTSIGDPSQLAKTIVAIKGIRGLSGNYYVSAVKHTIGGSGTYTMELKCKRDGRSQRLGQHDATNAASVNGQQPPPDVDALQPIEMVDPRTGQTTIQYTDTRGRPPAGGVEGG